MRMQFQEVSIKAKRFRIDPETGKKRQETRTFYQTINPFNRDATGAVKMRDQIMQEVVAERDAWLATTQAPADGAGGER